MLTKQEFRQFAVRGQGLNGLAVDYYLTHAEGLARQQFTGMTRSVIEERPARFAEIDVFSRLVMDRIIFLGQAVDDRIANIINAQLLFLESVDAQKNILLYINSPGGTVYAGFGIYDTYSTCSPTWPPPAPDWRPARAFSCWWAAPSANARPCPTRGS